MSQHFLEEAITSFDKALEIKPKDADIWYNREKALQQLGRIEEAITSFEQAISIKPDDPDIWYNRGDTLQKLGRFKEAIASYDKAIELKKDYPEAWYSRGKVLQQLKLTEEAIASYDKALKIRSNYPEARKDRDSLLRPLLSSEKNVDYIKLRDLLAAGKWEEADKETADKILEVIEKDTWQKVTLKDIGNFPCEDLRTIDQLWVKYSEGRFGFSIKKKNLPDSEVLELASQLMRENNYLQLMRILIRENIYVRSVEALLKPLFKQHPELPWLSYEGGSLFFIWSVTEALIARTVTCNI